MPKTTFSDIEKTFHSMPLTKFEIPEALEAEWLATAGVGYEVKIKKKIQKKKKKKKNFKKILKKKKKYKKKKKKKKKGKKKKK